MEMEYTREIKKIDKPRTGIEFIECDKCEGSGRELKLIPTMGYKPIMKQVDCSKCDGEGFTQKVNI